MRVRLKFDISMMTKWLLLAIGVVNTRARRKPPLAAARRAPLAQVSGYQSASAPMCKNVDGE